MTHWQDLPVRRIALRAALLAPLAFGVATATAAKDAPAAANAKPPSPSQFLDRSYVSLPKLVDGYTLDELTYEPNYLTSGVRTTYDLEGAPKQFTISLFVYPLGRGEEAVAVDQQIAAVEEGIRLQEDYTKIAAGPRTPFEIDAPPSSILPDEEGNEAPAAAHEPPAKEGDAQKDEFDQALAQATLESASPRHGTGRRQSFTFENKGQPVRSAGLVFYRNLYGIKLRISTPGDGMDQAEFDALVDATARALVPKIDIQNFGRCGEIAISKPEGKDEKKDSQAFAAELIREMGRIRRENCATGEGDKPKAAKADYERQEIVFPPGIWREEE